MKQGLRIVLTLVLLSLFLTSELTLAFNWWQAAGGAAAGATAGAVIGAGVFGPLGALVGAGIGALAGFIGASIPQLFANEPTTSSNETLWCIYAKDVYNSIAQQSQVIADQEITQSNLIQQSQLPFTLTAQKWEQVNYNENISPTSPYEFYQMLSQTGFLGYAAKLVGGIQSLWITEQSEINAIDQQLQYGYAIYYGTGLSYSPTILDPNSTVTYSGSGIVIIVQGNIQVSAGSTVTEFANGNAENVTISNTTTLGAGVYILYGTISINPNQGMVLAFSYNGNSYSPQNDGFLEPSLVYLTQNGYNPPLESTSLPQPSVTLILAVEQVAISMLGAAQTEYAVLKQLGYASANQIPSNFTLPTIDINLGNFSKFNSSLQAYNLYLAMYIRELLQLEQTLENLSASGKLAGLQQLSFNVSNPLSLYGQYGGFIENGSIVLPNGQQLHGLFLIQPYGGPLTLGPNGGVIGNGGAVAYSLIPLANGTYALGEEYTLPPNTTVGGHVLNPGTLGTVNQPQQANYLNTTTYQMPYTTTQSASSALNNLVSYLESHPLALLITVFFGLIIIVLIIRAIA
jgi:hypothetical protein